MPQKSSRTTSASVRRGKIVQMEVWNDSGEWLLVWAGLAKP